MRWFVGLLAVFAAAIFIGYAQRPAVGVCGSQPEIHVAVHPVFANPVYDFSYDVEGIQDLANNAVHQVREGWALGLTRYEPVLAMTAPIAAVPASNGGFCARPVSVDVDLGYKDMNVALPSELPGDGCGMEQILHHEDEHVDTSKQMLRKYLPLMRARLEEEVKANMNTVQPTAEQAVALQRNMLNAALIDVASRMAQETAAAQRDIDSPEEYTRMLSVCDGELADLVKDTRNARMLAQRF